MHELHHYRLCPFSRSIRLALDELQIAVDLIEERPWEWRPAFLAINPAGNLPVLRLDQGQGTILVGAYAISEYLGDTLPRHPVDGGPVPLFPGSGIERAECRQLVDWFHRKTNDEATRHLLEEKLYKRFRSGFGEAPDVETMRAVRQNLGYSLGYIDFLLGDRQWLAGDALSFADLAAAAHVSVADYLNEIDWAAHAPMQDWYARLKSRPSMRRILAERVPGAAPPPRHYGDPDF
ncbi:MAG: glutathione S-transferase family protein [Rhizobiales bacterium]|nr:glutathione S-transferase family protein [Hyphomicrobiales bacterium]